MNRENKRKTYDKHYYKTHPCDESFTCRSCGWLITPQGAGSQHRQHPDPGSTQCPRRQHRDEVDGKQDPCESGNGIEKPQADKAEEGVNAQPEKKPHGYRQQPKKQNGKNRGNYQNDKFFHGYLRISAAPRGILALDRKECERTVLCDDEGKHLPLHFCQVYHREDPTA